jgi:hypothetical protein
MPLPNSMYNETFLMQYCTIILRYIVFRRNPDSRRVPGGGRVFSTLQMDGGGAAGGGEPGASQQKRMERRSFSR